MKKVKHIRIRVTEEQFRRLSDVLVKEQKSKSIFLREMIDKYVYTCRKRNKGGVIQRDNEIPSTSPKNGETTIISLK